MAPRPGPQDSRPIPSVLEKSLSHLRSVLGCEVCVYDFSYFSYGHPDLKLTVRSRWHCSPYCMKIKESAAAQRACVACELQLSAGATRRHGSAIGVCHAGLTQMLLPILRGSQRLGIVSVGQVYVDSPRSRRALDKVAQTYGHNSNDLRRIALYQSVRSVAALKRRLPAARLLQRFIETTVDNQDLRRALTADMRPRSAFGRPDMHTVPNYFLDRFYNLPEAAHAILGAVRRNYWDHRPQSAYAREAGMSPRRLNTVLKQATGLTFRDILKKSRMSAAAYLLRAPGATVSNTAYSVGYEDLSAFSHAFKDVFGVSPTSYARRQVSVPEEHFVVE